MIVTFVLLIAGLVSLTAGAEALVRGSSRLAVALGLSPLVIGLTLVAYGTSAPELIVSTLAAGRDLPDVAVGNVVGSNIFNTGVVLGVSALFAPLPCRRVLVRREVPLLVLVTLLLWVYGLGGVLGRWEAAILLGLLVVYTAWSLRRPSADSAPAATLGADPERRLLDARSRWLHALLVLAGLGALALGAHWLVHGSIQLASTFGISERVIGLTIIAAGTSLPELATSVVAALRRQPDIAVGNVLGSNIFNVLGILGIAGLVRPPAVAPEMVRVDIPVALLFAVACLPILASANRITRGEGLVLFAGYVGYLSWLLAR